MIWDLYGESRTLEIDEAGFEQVRKAVEQLEAALGIEEKLDLVLANFAEYEGELLQLALTYMLDFQGEWASRRAKSQIVNRRIVNLLSAARLYLDHVRHELNAMFSPGSRELADFELATNAQFDNVLAYRFCEQLRNHVQHQGLPIQEIT
ncbi:MAG TPA: hypothetical protein VNA69_23860 [Thermoanaerobaculia bacterium]|nr:hypothetical protein [Thermoanaerobaculia bacterium]